MRKGFRCSTRFMRETHGSQNRTRKPLGGSQQFLIRSGLVLQEIRYQQAVSCGELYLFGLFNDVHGGAQWMLHKEICQVGMLQRYLAQQQSFSSARIRRASGCYLRPSLVASRSSIISVQISRIGADKYSNHWHIKIQNSMKEF